MNLTGPERRFSCGTGPEPRAYWGREPRSTGECTTCGRIFWLDEGHACRGPRRLARTAAISGVAAAFSTMGALAIWPAPAAIPGAVAVYATCLLLTHRTRSTS